MLPSTSPPTSNELSSSPPVQNNFSDGRKSHRRKDFHYKYGRRHHAYDNEKAPYPLSYDRNVLELEGLDNRFIQYLCGSISFAKFEEPPKRVLDLGCGNGAWIIDAAKAWLECKFVGFDLVDVQVPFRMLDKSIANRIEWKRGNFLTTKLPFDDGEFDHVHIQSIATGVPENKWGVLFEEVSRVLRPGGSVELIEDDIIFPILPRWFTTALRVHPLRNQTRYPQNSQHIPPPPLPPTKTQTDAVDDDIPTHEHGLIESLYRSVFDNRFINMKPSSVLPSYLTTYFRQVTLGPVLSFPMPPLAPPIPLPVQTTTTSSLDTLSMSTRSSTNMIESSSINNFTRPSSLSFSSTLSTATASMFTESKSLVTRPRTSSAPFTYTGGSISSFEMAFSNVSMPPPPPTIDYTTVPIKRYVLDNTSAENEEANSTGSPFLINHLDDLTERSLAMHLYRSYQLVMACQEAMWEELKDRIRNRRGELLPFGWEDDEELGELKSRSKFEKLMERYQSDMKVRVSLWHSLNKLGWPFPEREPLSKAELLEEERLRDCMMEARKQATLEEMQRPCRGVRVLIGYNL